MSSFHDVLFEISNEDRHRILFLIEHEEMNVTQIARKLGLSLTETSRHLSRIADVGLAHKNVDGLYGLSSFGRLFLFQVQGAEFISKHRDYFNAHTLESLPRELVNRMAELDGSSYVDDVMLAFFNVERMMKEAEEYFWNIADQYIMSTLPLIHRIADEKVRARSIDPRGYVLPAEMKERVPAVDREAAQRAAAEGLIEMKVLDRIDVFLWMSEKEVAALAFPTLDGRFDYLGFTSRDERVLNWCRDLFLYYWERAEPKREFSLF